MDRLQVDFGGHAAALRAEGALPGKTNYLHGNDPAKWRTGIANYSRLRYSQLYPGIDLVFYGNGEHLEHDFLLAPGADSGKIQMSFKGAEHLELDQQGNLLVQLGSGTMTFERPYAYQDSATGRHTVPATFQLQGQRVSFKVGRYDKRLPLVIDPVLSFATFLAGNSDDTIEAVAVDSAGNIYVTGETLSLDFPVSSVTQPFCKGCLGNTNEIFVAKLDPTAHTLIYSTLLGGNDFEFSKAIALDANGNAIISGYTQSPDFPSVNAIGTVACCNNAYAFIASLAPDGKSLNYGGVIVLIAPDKFTVNSPAPHVFVTVDPAGNAYASGQTGSPTFPTTPGTIAAVPTISGSPTLWAIKVNPTGGLVYSTAIPGKLPLDSLPPLNTFIPHAIAIDASGNAYIAGTAGDGLPTTA